jgi:hypothetical protein
MHSLSVTTLLLLHSFSRHQSSLFASAGSVGSIDLLPDLGLDSLGDFEILSRHVDGDEDVIHIRKRADSNNGGDCGKSNCLSYSGWTDNGKMVPEGTDLPELPIPTLEERSFEKRDRKTPMKGVCAGTALGDGQNVPDNAITISSPTWPDLDTLEEVRAPYTVLYILRTPTENIICAVAKQRLEISHGLRHRRSSETA